MLGNDVWLLPVFEVFLWTELNTAHDRVGHSTAIFFFFFCHTTGMVHSGVKMRSLKDRVLRTDFNLITAFFFKVILEL